MAHHVAANYAAFKNPSQRLGFSHMLRCCSFSEKSHACFAYALASAGMTAPRRYQLFRACAYGAMYHFGRFSHIGMDFSHTTPSSLLFRKKVWFWQRIISLQTQYSHHHYYRIHLAFLLRLLYSPANCFRLF